VAFAPAEKGPSLVRFAIHDRRRLRACPGKVEAAFPTRTCDKAQKSMSRKSMHSGFDPMGGSRFSDEDMRQRIKREHVPI
jgi:hypothetical protein